VTQENILTYEWKIVFPDGRIAGSYKTEREAQDDLAGWMRIARPKGYFDGCKVIHVPRRWHDERR
jgi:hypothetical protein